MGQIHRGDYNRIRPTPISHPLIIELVPVAATVVVEEGGNANLVCSAKGFSRSPTFEWKYGTTTINKQSRFL